MIPPNPDQIADWIRTLTNATRDPRALNERIHNALRRDATGTNNPDGYGTPNGPRSNQHADPVLATVMARLNPQDRDPHHKHTTTAWQSLAQAVDAINQMHYALAHIDAIVGPQPETPRCEILTDEPADHYADVSGTLPRNTHLSRAAYRFVDTYRRVPTPTEIDWYTRTGRWRVRVSTQTVKTR